MINIMFSSAINGLDMLFIGDKTGNASVDLSAFDSINNGLEICARSRSKYYNINQGKGTK